MVAIAGQRAAVLLGIVARHARLVRARVVAVENAVFVAICRRNGPQNQRLLLGLGRPFQGKQAADLRCAKPARQTGADASAEPHVVRYLVVRAEQKLERRLTLREEGVATGDDRRAEQLGTEHELSVVAAVADRSSDHRFSTLRRAVEAGVVGGAVEHAELGRVHQVADIAAEQQARQHAHLAVTGKGRLATGGREHRDASGQRDWRTVLTEQPHVGSQPQVTDRRAFGGFELRALHGATLAGLVGQNRQVHTQAQPVPQHQTSAHVHEQLVLNDVLQLVAVAIVEDERLFAEVAGGTQHQAAVAAHVQRISCKPVATALRWIEAIDGETSALGVGSSRNEGQ